MRDEILFWKRDWFAVVEGQKAGLRKRAQDLPADFFEDSSLDGIADQLVDEFSLNIPTIAPDEIEVSQCEIELEVSGRDDRLFSSPGPQHVKGTAIDVHLPFTGDKDMFFVKPSTFTGFPPRGRVQDGSITFTIRGTNLTRETVAGEIDGVVKSISEFLAFQEKSLGKFPQEIREVAYQAVERREKKLASDKDLVSGLGFKVR